MEYIFPGSDDDFDDEYEQDELDAQDREQRDLEYDQPGPSGLNTFIPHISHHPDPSDSPGTIGWPKSVL